MGEGTGEVLSDMSDDDVAREITAIGAHIAAATARLLDLLATADERGIWQDWDARSLGQFTSWLTGMAPHRARHHAEVATKIEQWPETKRALGTGAISFCQVAAITATDAPGFDKDLATIAVDASTAQLQAVTRGYRRALVIGGVEDHAFRRRYLDYFYDHDSFVLHGRLDRDDGAIVKCALDTAADELFRNRSGEAVPPGSDPDRLEEDERNVAALVAVAEGSLATTHAVDGGDSHQVVVHLDLATLAGADGDAEIEGAGAIGSDVARRIACDASVVTMLRNADKILSVGRKSRRPSRAIRRALTARDRMCCFPGCANNRYLDAHHIRYVVDGGETSLRNMLLLCRWHHRLIHRDRYTVELEGSGTPMFTRSDGTRLENVAARPSATPTDIVAVNRASGVDVFRPPEAPADAGRRIDWVDAIHTIFFQPSQQSKLPPDVRKHVNGTDPPPAEADPESHHPPPGGG